MRSKILIVGGGIFGLTSAIELAKLGNDVTIHEELDDVMKAASGINQYRLHAGYHYPRSKETARDCKESVQNFKNKYHSCIMNGSIDHYYSISKENSLISGQQYINFLDDMGLFYEETKPTKNCEVTIRAEEYLFSPVRLRRLLLDDVDLWNIDLKLNHKTNRREFSDFDYIIIGTYSKINELVDNKKEYQFEVCEKPVVKLPNKYKNKSIVVMDGPFMCLDPYDSTNYHVLGNVVHAIHDTTIGYEPILNNDLEKYLNKGIIENPKITNIDKFIDTGKVYFDEFEDLEHIGSMYTIRTVLKDREHDDARPTIVNQEDENVFSVFSGKIVTCIESTKKLIEVIDG